MIIDQKNHDMKGSLLMKTIIQQILTNTLEKYLIYFDDNSIAEISTIAEDFKDISFDMAKDMLNTYIDFMDQTIRDAKSERKEDGITIHQKDVERTLYTALGSLTYKRTYFNVPTGRSYLLDSLLGVEAYDRIDAGVSANLVNTAATYSYGRSADIVTSGQISRQSVRNKIMNTGEVLHVPGNASKTPEALHIFADEDHVNLQNGKNTIIPLVTVSEGKRVVSKGRKALIEPIHIHGYGIEPEKLWDYVYALCAEKYDMNLIREIYIYGDGGNWIKVAFDKFSKAIYVFDEFHFKKRTRSLFAGEICSAFRLPAYSALHNNDEHLFAKLIDAMIDAVEEKMSEDKSKKRKLEKIIEHKKFILNHWHAIQNAKSPGSIGSCTEAMVSHVLSERFSRSPMGWSDAGLSKMAMIRMFILNGDKISPVDVTAWKCDEKRKTVINELEKYRDNEKKQNDEIFRDVKNWRWFEVDNFISGKKTGTSVALKSLGTIRSIA
jgi:hypothetical protein